MILNWLMKQAIVETVLICRLLQIPKSDSRRWCGFWLIWSRLHYWQIIFADFLIWITADQTGLELMDDVSKLKKKMELKLSSIQIGFIIFFRLFATSFPNFVFWLNF